MAIQLTYTGAGDGKSSWVPGVPAANHLQNDEDLAAALVAAPEGLYTVASNYCFLPTNWNKGWLAAKANAANAPCWVGYWGDSIFQGYNTSNFNTKGVPQLISAYLKTQVGTEYGEYWPLADCVTAAATYTGTPPWVIGDTTHDVLIAAGIGTAGAFRWAGDAHPTASPNLATLTTPIACTYIDLIYTNHYNSSDSFTYTVDGGGTQTVNMGTASDNLQRVRIGPLSSATHTIVVTGQSADNAFILLGAACYPSNPATAVGVGFVRACQQGSVAGNAKSGEIPNNANYQYWSGVNDTSLGTAAFPTAPHLLIICMGINDLNGGGYTAAQMGDAIRYTIAAQRLGNPNSSAMIVAPIQPDPAVTDVVSNATTYTGFGAYREEMFTVAREMNAALVDYGSMMGSTPHAQGFIDTSHAPHLLDAGAAAVANMITPLV